MNVIEIPHHPTLAKHEECYFGDIAEVLNIAKPTVSQHLKELREAGLIKGEMLPPKVKYCINADTWDEMRSLFADFFELCRCGKDCECECD